MALSGNVGTVVVDGTIGTTFPVTGVGFQPKAIIFWWAGLVAATDAFGSGSYRKGIGVATGTTARWAVGTQAQDAVATSDNDRIHRSAACVATMTSAGAIDGLVDLQSFDADGFTLIVDDQFAIATAVSYLALGGTDLTNVAVGRFDEPAATGNQDITGVGFQPDCVLFGSIGFATDPDSLTTNAIQMVGAATVGQEGVLYNVSANAATTMDTKAYSRTGECIALSVAGATNARAELGSFLSDGFRLNWLERGADRVIFYLALKGGSYRIDDFVTSVTPAATITETGFGFSPRATMLFSHGRGVDTQDVLTDSDQWNVGGFTSTSNRVSQGVLDEDNVADSDLERYLRTAAALAQITTTPSLVGEVDVQSIDSDGFTLVMDSAADPAAFVWYISFGDTLGAAAENPYPYVGGGYYPTEG